MSTLLPCAGRHAIQTVSFGLEWDEPLTPTDFSSLRSVGDALRDALPRVREERSVQIVISQPPSHESPLGPPPVSGLILDSVGPDGRIKTELVIRQNLIAVNVNEYSDWEIVRDHAVSLFTPFLASLSSIRPIKVIGIQYLDNFAVEEKESKFRPADAFREKSRWLPEAAFQLSDLWHMHHGFFETLGEPTSHRRLTHLNVDLVKEQETKSLKILTAHRALIDNPIGDAGILLSENSRSGGLVHYLDTLHDLNVVMLKELLNDAVLRQIGLMKGANK